MKKFLAMLILTAMLLTSLTSCSFLWGAKRVSEGDIISNEDEHIHEFTRMDVNESYLRSEATCNSPASYYYSCLCGEISDGYFLIGDPKSHSFGEWEVYEEATTSSEGKERSVCHLCGAFEERSIPKLDAPQSAITPNEPVESIEPTVPVVPETPVIPVVPDEPDAPVEPEKPDDKTLVIAPITKKELTVDKIAPSVTELGKVNFTVYKDSLEKGETDTYSFKPEINGIYRFEMSDMMNNMYVDVYLYNSLGEKVIYDANTENQEGINPTLNGGETYTVKVIQKGGTGNYTLTIGAQKPTVDITNYNIVKDSVEYTAQTNVYTLTAGESGLYRFGFTDTRNELSMNVYVYNDLGERIKYNNYLKNNEALTVNLEKGKTYTVKVERYSGYGDYTLAVGKQKPTVDVTEYNVIRDSIEYGYQENFYTFTAPRNGIYNISFANMQSGTALAAYVYNDLGEKLVQSVSMKNGDSLKVELADGKTYTVKVAYYHSLGDYVFNFGIQKPYADITDIDTVKDSIEFSNQENVYLLTAKNDGELTLTVSGMDGSCAVSATVYNSLGEKIVRNSSLRNGYDIKAKLNAGETYKVTVNHVNGFTDYTLTIS